MNRLVDPGREHNAAVGQVQSFATASFWAGGSEDRINVMRTPSRFMPTRSRKQKSWLAWVGLGCGVLILLAGIASLALHYPLFITTALAVLVLLVTISARREKKRLGALANARHGESICRFARSFAARSTDTWIIRAVYEETQAMLGSGYAGFPLCASDRFIDLGVEHDDLDMDLVMSVSDRTGRSLDNPKANPFFGKVDTVADLVLFFNAQPLIERQELSMRAPAGA